MSDKYFVGIDQSFSGTGVVSIKGSDMTTEVARCFKAGKPKEPFHVRANDLIVKLKEVLPKPENTIVFMEGAAYAAEFNAFILGELSGAIKMFLFQNGYAYDIVQPTTLKKFATGNGRANKAMVIKAVAENWGFKSTNDNICDAYALARMASEASKKG